VIQTQILAASLLALGASTLHGMRAPAPAAPGLRGPTTAVVARDRVERAACARPPARERAVGCGG
jgi:hypothetical protein